MYTAAVIAILVTMVLSLIRAFMGPTIYDRMLAANVFGTKTVLLIAIGGHALSWTSFLDVALLYAMLNFVGTIAIMRFFEYVDPEEVPSEDLDEASDAGGKS
ncbi:MAG: pH regulation protein F [Magnetococcales bacterium]|nr:pH regulation protein F [Magnetococcales bacterium]